MSREFPGFEKSAPTKMPTAHSQDDSPTSSWDWDLSSVEKILEQQKDNSKQFSQTLSQQIEEMVQLLQKEFQSFRESKQQQQSLDIQGALLSKLQELEKQNQQRLERLEANTCNLPTQDFLSNKLQLHTNLAKTVHYCERMANSVEKLEPVLQENLELLKDIRQHWPGKSQDEGKMFWMFIVILLVIFVMQFVIPKFF